MMSKIYSFRLNQTQCSPTVKYQNKNRNQIFYESILYVFMNSAAQEN